MLQLRCNYVTKSSQNIRKSGVKMKKFLSLLLVLIMTFTVLSACSGDDDSDINNDDFVVKEIETMDLDGYEFIFEVIEHYGEPDLYPEENFSNTGDLTRQRYRDTEKAFNMTMEMRILNSYTAPTKLSSFAMSGEKYADLLENHAEHITKSLQLYLPFDRLSFDDDKWGTKGYLEAMNFGGEQYGVIAYFWGRPLPSFVSPLFFIPSRMNEYQLSSPFELIEKKEWTWANFEIMLRAFTQPSDIKAENKFGMGAPTSSRIVADAVIANGARPIKYDEATGKYKFALDDPAALEAMSWVQKLVNQEKTIEYINDWWEPASEGFINGKYGFNVEYSFMGFYEGRNHFATEIKEDYHWAPFPVGPKGTHGQWAAEIIHETRYIAMPIHADVDTDLVQTVMEYLFRPLDGHTKDTWKDEAYRQFFFDENSFKYYMEMVECAKTNYSNVVGPLFYDTGNNRSIIKLYQTITAGKVSPQEAVDKIKDVLQERIDETLNNPDYLPSSAK